MSQHYLIYCKFFNPQQIRKMAKFLHAAFYNLNSKKDSSGPKPLGFSSPRHQVGDIVQDEKSGF